MTLMNDCDLELVPKESADYRRVLEHYFPDRQGTNPRILNICCGAVVEEPAIFEHFGSGTDLVSVDNDNRPKLDEMVARLGRKSFRVGDLAKMETLGFLEGKYDIVLCRTPYVAYELQHYRDAEPGFLGFCLGYSFGFIRGEQVFISYEEFKSRSRRKKFFDRIVYGKPPENHWPSILENLTGFCKDETVLFFTMFEKDEFEIVQDLLREQRYRVEVAENNPHPVTNAGLGVNIDWSEKDTSVVIANPPLKKELVSVD